MKIIIFGDSNYKGVIYDAINNRYCLSDDKLLDKASKDLQVEIINKSVFGITSEKALKKFFPLSEEKAKDNVFVIEYGGNDSDFNWKEVSDFKDLQHYSKGDIKDFENNLISMIKDIRENGGIPVLATLTPISSEKYLNFLIKGGLSKDNILYWLKEINMIYRYNERYSFVIQKVALTHDCILIDVRDEFLKKNNCYDYICEDGIHLNNEGHKIVLDFFIRRLREEGLIKEDQNEENKD